MRISKQQWASKKKDKNGFYKLDFINEHELQAAIICYIKSFLPSLIPYTFAIPNGGLRHISVAKKLKAEGVMPGVSDLFIDIPNIIKHGLRIEVKSSIGKMSKQQLMFKERMESIGYVVEECRSINEFEAICCNYFGLEKLTDREIKSRIDCEKFIQDRYKGKYEPFIPSHKNIGDK